MNAGGPAGQLIDGRFELLDRLGGGGMGLVWRARDTMLQREVALKEVRTAAENPFMDEDPVAAHVMRERVLREARALARLHHPNVVTIYHIVDSAALRHPWLVMELVSGGSLSDRLERGPLLPQEAARVGRGVLAALRAAHEAGIQHRDVKPANVLLRADGTPVLTDFGIAALRESSNLTSLTATGTTVGSPEYIAPERIRGQEGDPASDLWSLGMLMYVAVEGANPLRRDTTLATLAAVLDAPIPQPEHSGPLTPALAALLVRDPAARPDAASLDQMLAAAEHAAMSSGYNHGSQPAGYNGPASYNSYGSAASYASNPAGGGAYGSAPSSHSSSSGSSHPQSPPGSSYAPFGVAYGPTDHPSGPLPGSAVLSPPRPRSRRNTVFVSGVAGIAVIGLAAALIWTLHDSSGSGPTLGAGGPSVSASSSASAGSAGVTDTSGASAASSAAGQTQTQSLLTATAMQSFIKLLRSTTGSTKVIELDAYPTHADVEVPVAADPTLYNDYTYQDGALTADPDFNGSVDAGQGTVDLTAVTWSVLPTLLKYAEHNLNIPNSTSEYIILDNNFENAPAIRVYESDTYGSGYLAADLKGHVTKTYPRGS